MSRSAAREKVRVAHALKELPEIAIAFSDGRLSYSKVRALTRVATSANEATLLSFALSTTAARVEERCHQMRNTGPEAVDAANRARGQRSLRVWKDIGRGTVTLTVELPIEAGDLVCQALDKAVEVDGECGETSLENTMLLCSAHHRLVHEGGYAIRKDHQGQCYFQRPDGRAVPACGYWPDDMVEEGSEDEPEISQGAASAEAGDVDFDLAPKSAFNTSLPSSSNGIRRASAKFRQNFRNQS